MWATASITGGTRSNDTMPPNAWPCVYNTPGGRASNTASSRQDGLAIRPGGCGPGSAELAFPVTRRHLVDDVRPVLAYVDVPVSGTTGQARSSAR